MVFRSDSFKKLIDDGELIYLVADWTNYDPLITKELERYKRGGVPLYLYWKIGEENPRQAKTASYSTIYMCIIAALLNIVIILSFKEFIVGIYTTDEVVFNLTVGLLIFAAIFQLPDGIQMGALGSLRGYKDTFGPMKIMAVSYWGVGLPLGIILSITDIITTQMGAVGMWTGMASGLLVAAVLMVRRVRKISTKFIDEN